MDQTREQIVQRSKGEKPSRLVAKPKDFHGQMADSRDAANVNNNDNDASSSKAPTSIGHHKCAPEMYPTDTPESYKYVNTSHIGKKDHNAPHGSGAPMESQANVPSSYIAHQHHGHHQQQQHEQQLCDRRGGADALEPKSLPEWSPVCAQVALAGTTAQDDLPVATRTAAINGPPSRGEEEGQGQQIEESSRQMNTDREQYICDSEKLTDTHKIYDKNVDHHRSHGVSVSSSSVAEPSDAANTKVYTKGPLVGHAPTDDDVLHLLATANAESLEKVKEKEMAPPLPNAPGHYLNKRPHDEEFVTKTPSGASSTSSSPSSEAPSVAAVASSKAATASAAPAAASNENKAATTPAPLALHETAKKKTKEIDRRALKELHAGAPVDAEDAEKKIKIKETFGAPPNVIEAPRHRPEAPYTEHTPSAGPSLTTALSASKREAVEEQSKKVKPHRKKGEHDANINIDVSHAASSAATKPTNDNNDASLTSSTSDDDVPPVSPNSHHQMRGHGTRKDRRARRLENEKQAGMKDRSGVCGHEEEVHALGIHDARGENELMILWWHSYFPNERNELPIMSLRDLLADMGVIDTDGAIADMSKSQREHPDRQDMKGFMRWWKDHGSKWLGGSNGAWWLLNQLRHHFNQNERLHSDRPVTVDGLTLAISTLPCDGKHASPGPGEAYVRVGTWWRDVGWDIDGAYRVLDFMRTCVCYKQSLLILWPNLPPNPSPDAGTIWKQKK